MLRLIHIHAFNRVVFLVPTQRVGTREDAVRCLPAPSLGRMSQKALIFAL